MTQPAQQLHVASPALPPMPVNQPPKLLDRVRAAIRARHYSIRTEEAYVGWITRFIVFHNKRHPSAMAEPEINQFLTHLAIQGNVAASTQNQALAALLVLYNSVLDKKLNRMDGVVRAKKPKRLPVVLTPGEVKAVLDRMSGAELLVALLLYGAGLRLLEASHATYAAPFLCHRLLQVGYDIRTVQELLRHSDVRTTEIHTHALLNRGGRGVQSPLDRL